jgi:hypothetical protein
MDPDPGGSKTCGSGESGSGFGSESAPLVLLFLAILSGEVIIENPEDFKLEN